MVTRRSGCTRTGHRARHDVLAFVFIVFLSMVCRVTFATDSLHKDRNVPSDSESSQSVTKAVDWLSAEANKMIRSSRRTMADGKTAFPPQVGKGYDAFWLRDYYYMLEGAIGSFSDEQLKDACRLFVGAVREDGAAVDCIKFDGTPIYKPGYGRMGDKPVADGSPFTVAVAWHTFRRTKDLALLRSIIDRLELTMNAMPRNPRTGLVHIKPGRRQERCPYGFTDTVPKQGDVLFCSLLFVQAGRQMADLYQALDRPDDSHRWSAEADRVAKAIGKTLWNPQWSLFRAATVKCNQPDVWGSIFAVSLGVADDRQSRAIARFLQNHYDKIVRCGQIRHLPRPLYWEGLRYRDRYQNGGYWATPVGWFVYTLDMVDPALADKTILDMVNDFRRRGVNEWIYGDQTVTPDYIASVALPVVDIRRMLLRREKKAQNTLNGSVE